MATPLNLQGSPGMMPQDPFSDSSEDEETPHQIDIDSNSSMIGSQMRLENRLAKYCLLWEAVRRLPEVNEPEGERPDEDDTMSMTFSEDEDEGTPLGDFKDFLDCLAEVCSFDRKSYMVTAILVEKTDEGVVFHVTRNSPAHSDEEQTLVAFLEELLLRIGNLQGDKLVEFEQSPAYEELLGYIVMDSVPRIKCYQSGIRRFLSECMEHKSKDNLPSHLRHHVENLSEAAMMSLSARKPDDVLKLISVAERFAELKSEFKGALTPSAAADSPLPSRWDEVFHNVSRLRSYQRNVSVFFLARRQFGELFGNFKVQFLAPKPPVSTNQSWSEGQLSRYFSKKPYDKKPLPEDYVESVQEKLRDVYKEGFERQVHAEVALSHWFQQTRGFPEMSPEDTAGAFFMGFGYVACSKPCCSLCYNYFCIEKEQNAPKCRNEHPNLYPRWTLPGFELCTTDTARRAHTRTYQEISEHLRYLIQHVVLGSKQKSDYRTFDSESDI